MDAETDKTVGFQRPEMFSKSTKGTVSTYKRHIFVSAGHPETWPSKSLKEFPVADKLSSSAPVRHVQLFLGTSHWITLTILLHRSM
jgi:hypothetical protein